MNVNPIDEHENLSPFYRFRPPYVPALFQEVARHLQLSEHSRLLDVCCGGGELVAGFAPMVEHIDAIDGSAAMMASAPQLPNVRYAQADANAGSFRAEKPADHIVIGRAVHWLTLEGVRALVRDNLSPDGSIVVCFSGLAPLPWRVALRGLLERWGRPNGDLDYSGQKLLTAAGFTSTWSVSVKAPLSMGRDTLLGHELSLAYGDSLARILANQAAFEREFDTELAPYLQDGRVHGELRNWAIVYRRTA